MSNLILEFSIDDFVTFKKLISLYRIFDRVEVYITRDKLIISRIVPEESLSLNTCFNADDFEVFRVDEANFNGIHYHRVTLDYVSLYSSLKSVRKDPSLLKLGCRLDSPFHLISDEMLIPIKVLPGDDVIPLNFPTEFKFRITTSLQKICKVFKDMKSLNNSDLLTLQCFSEGYTILHPSGNSLISQASEEIQPITYSLDKKVCEILGTLSTFQKNGTLKILPFSENLLAFEVTISDYGSLRLYLHIKANVQKDIQGSAAQAIQG
jgi:hypothetical protein